MWIQNIKNINDDIRTSQQNSIFGNDSVQVSWSRWPALHSFKAPLSLWASVQPVIFWRTTYWAGSASVGFVLSFWCACISPLSHQKRLTAKVKSFWRRKRINYGCLLRSKYMGCLSKSWVVLSDTNLLEYSFSLLLNPSNETCLHNVRLILDTFLLAQRW